MQPVSIFLNILWLLLGGVWMAVGWVVAAIIMAITIIGLPWARAAFNIAAYTLLPFGQKAVRRDSLTGQSDLGGLVGADPGPEALAPLGEFGRALGPRV